MRRNWSRELIGSSQSEGLERHVLPILSDNAPASMRPGAPPRGLPLVCSSPVSKSSHFLETAFASSSRQMSSPSFGRVYGEAFVGRTREIGSPNYHGYSGTLPTS